MALNTNLHAWEPSLSSKKESFCLCRVKSDCVLLGPDNALCRARLKLLRDVCDILSGDHPCYVVCKGESLSPWNRGFNRLKDPGQIDGEEDGGYWGSLRDTRLYISLRSLNSFNYHAETPARSKAGWAFFLSAPRVLTPT
jgi:hypothetical protein